MSRFHRPVSRAQIVSVQQAAEILGRTRQAILARIQSGALPAARVYPGGPYCLQKRDLKPCPCPVCGRMDSPRPPKA